MEVLLSIVFIIGLGVYLHGKFSELFTQNTTLLNKADKLEYELHILKALVATKEHMAPREEASSQTSADSLPVVVTPVPEKTAPVAVQEEAQPHEEIEIPVTEEEVYQERFDVVEEPVAALQEEAVKEKAPDTTISLPSFFDNLDWEKFIGENLINKIGIGILVLGIGFFVKYAIDQDWINEIGRVFIGIVCGGILVGLAHRLRKQYSAFSSVLIGGGLSVLYFSVSIAFHEYQLIGQTAAFLIMVLITAFAVQLSVAYNRQELAVLAIIGGFSSPFLVSTGEGNYVVLFTYLLILNTGMLVLANFKKWNIVNIVSYAFTFILYAGWLSSKVVGKPNAPYAGALVFATLFYLEFFLMNIINNIKEKRNFISVDFTILLSNTFGFYSAGMIILEQIQGGVYQGLFTVALAAFNFIFAYSLLKSNRVDKNVVYLLIGLVVTFISLAAPVQLEGNWITMFWALESVLLLWLAKKSGIYLMRVSSAVLILPMVLSLIMDWQQLYIAQEASQVLPVLLNKAFITSLMVLASFYLNLRLLKHEPEDFFMADIPLSYYRAFILALLTLGSYVALLLELNYQLKVFISVTEARMLYLGIYHYIWLAGIAYVCKEKITGKPEYALPVLSLFSTGLYFFNYHGLAVAVRNAYLTEGSLSLAPFIGHYIIVLLLISILAFTLRDLRANAGFKSIWGTAGLWAGAFISLALVSAELDHLVVLSLYATPDNTYDLLDNSRRIGYPLVWGACSFIFMLIGIRKKVRQLRIISLSIFSIILLKLFLVDVSRMPEGGKIVAFIILGLLLLIISFLYQKLKKLLTEDEAPAAPHVQTPLT